jgi:hypothetical protein
MEGCGGQLTKQGGSSMKRIATKLSSPALLVAVVALIVALAGGAYAGTKIGTNLLRNGAVTMNKIHNGAISTPKLRRGAVTSRKIAPGAVGSAQIADGAITPDKLSAGQGSAGPAGFATSEGGSISLNVDPPELTGAERVAQLTLPDGNYVVTASVELGASSANPTRVNCALRDAPAIVAQGAENLAPLAVFSGNIALTGTSDGGVADLLCSSTASAQARFRNITAVRVGSIQP